MDVADPQRIEKQWAMVDLPETTDAGARQLAQECYAQGWRDGVYEMRRYLVEWAIYFGKRDATPHDTILAEALHSMAMNTDKRPPTPVTSGRKAP